MDETNEKINGDHKKKNGWSILLQFYSHMSGLCLAAQHHPGLY
jgi:hypothetical protein